MLAHQSRCAPTFIPHAPARASGRFIQWYRPSFALSRWSFPLALVMLPSLAARAQQPKLEMHRAGVDNKDPSGWHLAVSTKGAFSVRMSIPFNDFTVRSTDPKTGEEVTHVIGGKSAEGIKLSAVEMLRRAG
jgi:hypothetical protein